MGYVLRLWEANALADDLHRSWRPPRPTGSRFPKRPNSILVSPPTRQRRGVHLVREHRDVRSSNTESRTSGTVAPVLSLFLESRGTSVFTDSLCFTHLGMFR